MGMKARPEKLPEEGTEIEIALMESQDGFIGRVFK